jgi:ATP-dependent DNA helicase DinG
VEEVADLVGVATQELALRCQSALCENGHLSFAIPTFVARTQQVELASAIADAISAQKNLVVEAGTGTGKTFSYLVPCLLSGKKTIISTATKTLQDQLFHKDLPVLLGALGKSIRVQNLKGRANYICRYRTEEHMHEERLAYASCTHELAYVREKLPQLIHGEKNELPDLREDSPIWPYITSTADNCLGHECAHHSTCFLMKARKRALEADLVVINHHLFFADSRLKEDGLGEILPGVEIVVFDEAHQLAEIATNFYGDRVSTRQCRELMDDLLHECKILDGMYQELQAFSDQLDIHINHVVANYSSNSTRCNWDELTRNTYFITAWNILLEWFEQLSICLATVDIKEQPGLGQCVIRAQELRATLLLFNTKDATKIRWVEIFKHTLVFNLTLYDIQQPFQELLKRQHAAYIFTSATLTMANSFNCFLNSLGFAQVDTLLLPSPFDFKRQSLLYLPRQLPDPHHIDYYAALLKRVVPLMNACGGRCFFLFTSHRALQLVSAQLSKQIEYPVLVQGDESKPILLDRFRELGNAVLLGTSTFWEGVDVKGAALSCVIIDKLPFLSPNDPIINARMLELKTRGLSGFDELSLPHAITALKQGVGRLIRDVTDHGILVIADPRLTGREYGRKIFASLPAMRKTRDENTVLDFIKVFTNETLSA